MKFKLVEDSQLYKGIFWIVKLDEYSLNSYYWFLIPTTLNRDNTDTAPVNAKSGTPSIHEST